MTGDDEDATKVETTLPRSRSRSRSATKARPKPGPSILEVLNCKKDKEGDKPVVKGIETFASIASRPPLPKATRLTVMEAAISAATDELAAAISKHSADFHALLTSSSVKRTPARENRIRADNVALMTAATIEFSKLGELALLWRGYTRLRGRKRGLFCRYLRRLPPTPMLISAGQRPILVKDSEGYFTVNRRSRSPLLTGNIPPHQEGRCELTSSRKIFRRPGRMI
jgi:hypothetical protein